jgi:hypothetical protein
MSDTTTGAAATGPLLEFDAQAFSSQFPSRPFLVRHRLADHPLFAIQRLLDLSKALSESSVEYNEGNIPVNMDQKASPRTGLSVEETIRRIRDAHSWMVLKFVEQDASYRALLDQCLDQVQALSEGIVPGMSNRQGFIFLSSPNSVTPFHVDPEHNFLLQVQGTKFVTIFDAADTEVITEEDIEKGLFGGLRNLRYDASKQSRGQTFELKPGMGLHFPVAAPHFVQNGPDVSVSFSITFRSRASERWAEVRQMNLAMRKRGLQPAPLGESAMGDEVKFQLARVLRRVSRVLPGQE